MCLSSIYRYALIIHNLLEVRDTQERKETEVEVEAEAEEGWQLTSKREEGQQLCHEDSQKRAAKTKKTKKGRQLCDVDSQERKLKTEEDRQPCHEGAQETMSKTEEHRELCCYDDSQERTLKAKGEGWQLGHEESRVGLQWRCEDSREVDSKHHWQNRRVLSWAFGCQN